VKRIVYFIIAVVFLSFSIPATAEAKGYKDIKSTDWFNGTVMNLSDMGIIDGYPSGEFKPHGTVNVDAFIKMAVTALGHTDIKNGLFYWAKPYINKAKELGLVIDGEFASYTRAICRNEMARIAVRALNEEYPDNLKDYKSLITDYSSIYKKYQDYVLKAYCKGILTGYTDGSFKGEDTATRAEAATIIHRIIEPAARAVVVLPTPKPTPTPLPTPGPITGSPRPLPDGHIPSCYIAGQEEVEYLPQDEIDRLKQYEDNYNASPIYDVALKRKVDCYRDNENFIKTYGYEWARMAVAVVTGYYNTAYTFDYENIDDEFKNELKNYVEPQNYNRKLNFFTKTLGGCKTKSEGYFMSHPSLVYQAHNGSKRIRGVLRYRVLSCTDVEDCFGEGAVLGEWLEEDVEAELMSMTVGVWDYYYGKTHCIGEVIRVLD